MYIRRKDVKLKEKEEILVVEIMQSFIDSLRDNVNHCIMKRKGNKDVDTIYHNMYDLFLSQIDKRRRVLYSHFAVYIDYLIDALNMLYNHQNIDFMFYFKPDVRKVVDRFVEDNPFIETIQNQNHENDAIETLSKETNIQDIQDIHSDQIDSLNQTDHLDHLDHLDSLNQTESNLPASTNSSLNTSPPSSQARSSSTKPTIPPVSSPSIRSSPSTPSIPVQDIPTKSATSEIFQPQPKASSTSISDSTIKPSEVKSSEIKSPSLHPSQFKPASAVQKTTPSSTSSSSKKPSSQTLYEPISYPPSKTPHLSSTDKLPVNPNHNSCIVFDKCNITINTICVDSSHTIRKKQQRREPSQSYINKMNNTNLTADQKYGLILNELDSILERINQHKRHYPSHKL